MESKVESIPDSKEKEKGRVQRVLSGKERGMTKLEAYQSLLCFKCPALDPYDGECVAVGGLEDECPYARIEGEGGQHDAQTIQERNEA